MNLTTVQAGAGVVCPSLPATGLSPRTPLTVAVALVIAGGLVVWVSRRGPRSAAVIALLLLVCAAFVLPFSTTAAMAAADDLCASPSAPAAPPASSGAAEGVARVVVEQTSINDRLAPGVVPSRLAGQITNPSAQTVHVTAVTVSILNVTKSPTAPAGACSSSDYVIIGDWMPVDAVLAPGQSVGFDGALIGFVDKSVNQDACKGATVSLRYDSS